MSRGLRTFKSLPRRGKDKFHERFCKKYVVRCAIGKPVGTTWKGIDQRLFVWAVEEFAGIGKVL